MNPYLKGACWALAIIFCLLIWAGVVALGADLWYEVTR